MARHPILFDMNHLLQAQLQLVREARALRPGSERNQKRQVARALKRLIESQIKARDTLVGVH
jgi:hypothetical protein